MTEYFGRVASKNDLSLLMISWIQGCERETHPATKSAIKELKLRISAAGSSRGAKAKLNFSNCQLNDGHVKLLVESLASSPIISKLDLSGNLISDKVFTSKMRLTFISLFPIPYSFSGIPIRASNIFCGYSKGNSSSLQQWISTLASKPASWAS